MSVKSDVLEALNNLITQVQAMPDSDVADLQAKLDAEVQKEAALQAKIDAAKAALG